MPAPDDPTRAAYPSLGTVTSRERSTGTSPDGPAYEWEIPRAATSRPSVIVTVDGISARVGPVAPVGACRSRPSKTIRPLCHGISLR